MQNCKDSPDRRSLLSGLPCKKELGSDRLAPTVWPEQRLTHAAQSRSLAASSPPLGAAPACDPGGSGRGGRRGEGGYQMSVVAEGDAVIS